MHKKITIIFVLFLSIFLFKYNVYAECSYKERKELLNSAKNIDIAYEIIKNENDTYSFKFNVVGITDNIFVSYQNDNNGIVNYIDNSDVNDGIYSFVDDNYTLIYNYKFTMYSQNENCSGTELYSTKIKKPMYNIFSKNINCTFKNNSKFEYCKKFLDKDLKITTQKFNEELMKYNTKTNEKEDSEIEQNNSILKIIIIALIIVTIIIFIIFLINFVKRKKSEL